LHHFRTLCRLFWNLSFVRSLDRSSSPHPSSIAQDRFGDPRRARVVVRLHDDARFCVRDKSESDPFAFVVYSSIPRIDTAKLASKLFFWLACFVFAFETRSRGKLQPTWSTGFSYYAMESRFLSARLASSPRGSSCEPPSRVSFSPADRLRCFAALPFPHRYGMLAGAGLRRSVAGGLQAAQILPNALEGE
jgi:hypothetical protein